MLIAVRAWAQIIGPCRALVHTEKAVALLLFLLSTVLINVYLNVPNNSNSILY